MIKSSWRKAGMLVALFFSVTVAVFAQAADSTGSAKSTSPTVNPTTTQAFIDRLATASANMNDKKAVSGFVTAKTANSLSIKTSDDEDYMVKLDNMLTKYYEVVGNSRKEIKLDNIEKGQYAIAAGVINDKSVDPTNSVNIDQSYIVKSGKISEVNSDDYTLTVVATDKETYALSIETMTKQQIVNSKTLEIEKVGFSKIKGGDTIHFVAREDGTEKNNTYSALRILILPQEYFMQ